MTKEECKQIKKVLERIKDPDGHVKQAIAACDRQLAVYEAKLGQMKENYETDFNW